MKNSTGFRLLYARPKLKHNASVNQPTLKCVQCKTISLSFIFQLNKH